jgi:hypothetical protein
MSDPLEELIARLGIRPTSEEPVRAGAIPSIPRTPEQQLKEHERLKRGGYDYGGLDQLRRMIRRRR